MSENKKTHSAALRRPQVKGPGGTEGAYTSVAACQKAIKQGNPGEGSKRPKPAKMHRNLS